MFVTEIKETMTFFGIPTIDKGQWKLMNDVNMGVTSIFHFKPASEMTAGTLKGSGVGTRRTRRTRRTRKTRKRKKPRKTRKTRKTRKRKKSKILRGGSSTAPAIAPAPAPDELGDRSRCILQNLNYTIVSEIETMIYDSLRPCDQESRVKELKNGASSGNMCLSGVYSFVPAVVPAPAPALAPTGEFVDEKECFF